MKEISETYTAAATSTARAVATASAGGARTWTHSDKGGVLVWSDYFVCVLAIES